MNTVIGLHIPGDYLKFEWIAAKVTVRSADCRLTSTTGLKWLVRARRALCTKSLV